MSYIRGVVSAFGLVLVTICMPACSEQPDRPTSFAVAVDACLSICRSGVVAYEYKGDPLQTRCECKDPPPCKTGPEPARTEPTSPDAGSLFWCEPDDAGVFWCGPMKNWRNAALMACVSVEFGDAGDARRSR